MSADYEAIDRVVATAAGRVDYRLTYAMTDTPRSLDAEGIAVEATS